MTKRRAVAVGALGLYALSVQAQDTEGPRESGLRMTLDLDQQISVDSNAGLTPGGEPTTTDATTRLTFNLISETPIDVLDLSVGGVFRIERTPTKTSPEARLDDPSLRLSFARDVGHSSLTASANYARTPVEFTRPLSDFTDPDTGEIVRPSDLTSLQGNGDRISQGFALGLELGKEAPLGLRLNLSESRLRYSDTTAAGLFRTKTRNAGIGLRATLTELVEGRADLSRETFEAGNAAMTDRVTDRASFGATYSASESLTLTGSLGYSRSETAETMAGLRATQVEKGVTLGASASYDRPNGTITLSFDSDVDQNARRNTIEVRRMMDLTRGSLTAAIGLTRGAADKTQVIGSLNWGYELPTGTLSAQVTRAVTNDNNDNDRLSTSVSLGYTHQITELSSFGLTASHSSSKGTGGGTRSTRTNATATYSLQVNEDWSLNSGIEFRRTDTSTTNPATGHRFFFGIGRSFDLRP